MQVKLVDLLAGLLSRAGNAEGPTSPGTSGAFDSLLQQLQAANTAEALAAPVTTVAPDTEAGTVAEAALVDESAESPDSGEGETADAGVVTSEGSGPPAHRNHPEVDLPEAALLHALHSNGAPFERYRTAVAPSEEALEGGQATLSKAETLLINATAVTELAQPATPTKTTDSTEAATAEAAPSRAVTETSRRAPPGSVVATVVATAPAAERRVVELIGTRSSPDPAVSTEAQHPAAVRSGELAEVDGIGRTTAAGPSGVPERPSIDSRPTVATSVVTYHVASADSAEPVPARVPGAAGSHQAAVTAQLPDEPAPPPADDAFVPTKAAQHRAARAGEVLSALRSGVLPPERSPAAASSARLAAPVAGEAPAVPSSASPVVESNAPQENPQPVRPEAAIRPAPDAATGTRAPAEAQPTERSLLERGLGVQPARSEDAASALPVAGAESGRTTAQAVDRPTQASFDRPAPRAESIGQSVVQSVRHLFNTGNQTVVVKLMPESLGELHVTVTSGRDTIEVVLTSANQHVRQTLEHQLHALRETLVREGIDVTKATVAAPVAADNDVQTSFTRGGGQSQLGERHSSHTPSYGGSTARDSTLPNETRRSWNPHDGRLNVFV